MSSELEAKPEAPAWLPDETNEAEYEYTRLRNRSSIRLLTLLPGRGNDPLRCCIDEYEKDTIPPYEAISYTWGQPKLSHLIHVSQSGLERYIRIRHNLFTCLHRLRSKQLRTLWIDALCIDQDNLEEKGHQVTHMGRIYSQAARVSVWLGTYHEFQHITALAWGYNGYDRRRKWRKLVWYRWRAALEELMKMTWFTRVWTVQEFLLAKDVMFCLGPTQVPVDIFELAIRKLLAQSYKAEDRRYPERIEFIELLFDYRHRVQSSMKENRPPMPLTQCFLDLACNRDCENARDRIYAMLGIAKDIGITPNYSLTLEQVFVDLLLKSLEAGDFRLLHACCISNPGLASHAPHFDNIIRLNQVISYDHNRHYPTIERLVNMQHPAPYRTDHRTRLSVRCALVDKVSDKLLFEKARTHLDLPKKIDDRLPVHAPFTTLYRYILDRMRPRDLKWRADYWRSERTNFARTPTFRTEAYPHASLFEVLIQTLETATPSSKRTAAGKSMSTANQFRLQRRCLFWTTKGYIGLGASDIEPGDQLVIFDRDTGPLVLRDKATYLVQETLKLKKQAARLNKRGATDDAAEDMQTRLDDKRREMADTKPGEFKLVCDCYLHGWATQGDEDNLPVGESDDAVSPAVTRMSLSTNQGARVSPVTGADLIRQTFVIS